MLENGCHIPYIIYVGYKNMAVISTLRAVPDDVLITGIHCILDFNSHFHRILITIHSPFATYWGGYQARCQPGIG